MEGKVKFFNARKGFGFVVGDDGKDYFVHISAIGQGVELFPDDAVSFDAVDGERGMQAQNVQKIQGGSAPAQEETTPEEPASEETPAQEPASEETPAQEPASEETPAQEPASEETPAQEPASEETPAQEPASEETPAQEPASEEKPAE
jgi:cold shock CspA family protein